MGSIPRFQRQKLASSVVGTAGVDVSHEALFTQANQISEVAKKAAFALQAERNRAVDGAEVNKLTLDFERDMDKSIIEKQSSDTFLDHPDDIFDSVLSDSLELGTSSLEFASNDRVKTSFANLQQQLIRNRMASLQKWASDAKVAKAASDLTASVNTLSSSAFQTDNLEDVIGVNGTFAKLEQSMPIARAVYGPKKANTEFLQEGREAIAKGYLQGQIQRNPLFAKHVLDNEKVFQEILSGDDRKQLNKDIKTAIESTDKRNNLNVLIAGYGRNKEMANKFATGNLEVVEIDTEIIGLEESIDEAQRQVAGGREGMKETITNYKDQIEYLNTMRSMVLKGSDFDAVRDARAMNEFYNEWNQIYNKVKKQVISKSYTDVVRFQIKAAKMAEQKKITADVFRQITNQLSSTLVNKAGPLPFKGTTAGPRGGFLGLQDLDKSDDKPVDAFNNGFKRIWSWFNDNQPEGWEKNKAEALYDYIEEYDKRTKVKGIDLTYDEAAELGQKEVNRQVQRANSDVIRAGEKGQLFRDSQGIIARVFPDGRIEEVK